MTASTIRTEVSRGNSGAWHWRCWACGWVGFNCGSQSFAELESSKHVCQDQRDARIAVAARSYVALRWDFAEDAFSTDVSARCAMDAAWLELVAACTEDETP